jgi:hypothetical protein
MLAVWCGCHATPAVQQQPWAVVGEVANAAADTLALPVRKLIASGGPLQQAVQRHTGWRAPLRRRR